jgi:hypothetical protein
VDRVLFATGAVAFATHVGHHLVAGDEGGPLFFACLMFTVVVLAVPVAPTWNRYGILRIVALGSGIVATAAGIGNHVVLALITGPTPTDASGLLTILGGGLMVAAVMRVDRRLLRTPLTLRRTRRRLV